MCCINTHGEEKIINNSSTATTSAIKFLHPAQIGHKLTYLLTYSFPEKK